MVRLATQVRSIFRRICHHLSFFRRTPGVHGTATLYLVRDVTLRALVAYSMSLLMLYFICLLYWVREHQSLAHRM